MSRTIALELDDSQWRVLMQMVEYAADQASQQVTELAPIEVIEQASRYCRVADQLVQQVLEGLSA